MRTRSFTPHLLPFAIILFVAAIAQTAFAQCSANGLINVKECGPTGTPDDTATFNIAIQKASIGNAGNGSVYVPPGHYKICNLQLTPSVRMYGDSPRLAVLMATSGCKGSVVTDNGNAVGIFFQGFQVDANHERGITSAVKFGMGKVEFGTYGLVSQLFVRNADYGFCIQIRGNIATMRDLASDTCQSNQFGGEGNTIDGMSSVNSTVKGIEDVGVGNLYMGQVEVEAPSNGSVPIAIEHLRAQVLNPIISLTNSVKTHFTTLISVAPSAVGTRVTGIQIFPGLGTFNSVLSFGNKTFSTPVDFVSGLPQVASSITQPPSDASDNIATTAFVHSLLGAGGQSGGTKTAWTPVAQGLIESGGPSSITGYYQVMGSLVFVEISISPAGSTSSAAGSTSFSLPVPNSVSSATVAASSGRAYYPGGLVAGGRLYPGPWTADSHTVLVSGWYFK